MTIMLELFINDHLVVLDPDIKFTLKILNPLFCDQGTFTHPISAPLEPNRHIFEHADQEDMVGKPAYKFKMYIGGSFFAEGDAVITDTVDQFEFYLKSGKSAIANVLKKSYLDESINQFSWGENPNGLDGINASAGKIYPESPFFIAPIAGRDEIFNKWDSAYNGLLGYTETGYVRPPRGEVKSTDSKNFSPMVYVSYIIRRMIQGMGFVLVRNDSAQLPDFNRIGIFAPKDIPYRTSIWGTRQTGWSYKYSGLDRYFKYWMPHITVSTFIKDLRSRFNLAVYFSPLKAEAKIIHLDKIFDEPVIDLTSRFIEDEAVPPIPNTGVKFENSGESTEVMTNAQIEESFEIHPATNVDDIIAQIEADLTKTKLYFKAADTGRYYTYESVEHNETSIDKFYFTTFEETLGTTTYCLFDLVNPTESTENPQVEFSATGTSSNVLIKSFVFPVLSGKVNHNLFINDLMLKATASCSVKIQVSAVTSTGIKTILGSETITVDNTEYKEYVYALDPRGEMNWVWIIKQRDITVLLDISETLVSSAIRLLVEVYLVSSPGVTCYMMLDQRFWPDWPIPYAYIDTPSSDIFEMNPIANAEFGNTNDDVDAEVTTFSPSGLVPFLVKKSMNRYYFQMPYADISTEAEQKNWVYVVNRGFITDEMGQGGTAPFASPDVVDRYGKEYVTRLTTNVTPLLSLRWEGEKGLVKQLFRNSVPWILNFRRDVVKRMNLSTDDLNDLDLHNRIKIYNKLYFIYQISVPVNARTGLDVSTVDLITI